MTIQGYHPRTAHAVGEPVAVTTATEVRALVSDATAAAPAWAESAAARADALVAVADALDDKVHSLVAIADTETALGIPRLTNEVARTTGQLRMFAEALHTGRHLDVILSPANPARPDLRRMLQPMGPVAVFAASNFPFAFSVAGGDTASALAAGCPVVVKAHEGHPHTSLIVAEIMRSALPEGVFALVNGREAGAALVQEPGIKAVGFTGSLRGGRALFDLAQGRPDPIPFYGELGSVNPVVVLPGGAKDRRHIAAGYATSLTLGAGQFCTNPGLMFVPHDKELLSEIATAVSATTAGAMLNEHMHRAYVDRLSSSGALGAGDSLRLRVLATGKAADEAWAVTPRVTTTDIAGFITSAEELCEETFGPMGLVVTYSDTASLLSALELLPGSLTGTVHAAPDDDAIAAVVSNTLRHKVGRLVYNGWPTGVAVCWAMHHGGPWPASTSAAHTSVGVTAMERWLVPIAYQDWPEHLLPEPLRTANPLSVPQVVQR